MYHKLGLYIGIKPRQHRVTCPTVSVLLLVYNSNQPLLLDLAELPNQRPFFFNALLHTRLSFPTAEGKICPEKPVADILKPPLVECVV